MGVIEELQPGLDSGGLQDSLPCFFCLIPQQPPQQFPTGVLRNNVDELNPARQMFVRCLRIRDVLASGKVFKFTTRQPWIENTYLGDLRLHKLPLSSLDPFICLRTGDNKSERDFPTVFVRYSNDTNIGHEGIVQEMTLEFCGCNLKTADFHDLLEAVNDKNIVIWIDNGFVSRADPSRRAKSEIISEEGRQSHVPIYESFFRTGGDEETLSSYVFTAREVYSRLYVIGIPQRVRWAVNHQLSLFTWATVRAIELEQPSPNAR